jgi:hypothetical protein
VPAKTTPMAIPVIRPLLNRRPFLPNESLSSLFVRLQKANYYVGKSVIAAICRSYLEETDNVFLPADADTFRVLAEVTRLPVLDLYQATFHRYAAAFILPGDEAKTITLPSGEQIPLSSRHSWQHFRLPSDDAQYCPHCLVEGGYHRSNWLNLLVTVCPKHCCLLQRQCPGCSGKLSVENIVDGECKACHFNLAETPATDVVVDAWGVFTQTLIQSWLGNMPAPEISPNVMLPEQPASVLLELLWGLSRAVMQMPSEEIWHTPSFLPQPLRPSEEGRPLPAQIYVLYASTLRVVTNWPHNFYQFLAAYRHHIGDETGQITADFSSLYVYWLEKRWKRSEFAFVQEAFEDFLVAHYPLSRPIIRIERYQQNQSFRDRFPYLTEVEAARLLNVDPETVHRLVEMGTLVNFERGENQRLHWHKRLRLVRRVELEALWQRWQVSIPLTEVTLLLGVSEDIVIDLVNVGLLTEARQVVVDDGSELRIDTLSFSVLTGRLRRYPLMFYNEPKFLPLMQVTQLLAERGYGVVQVIQHVVSGDLKAVWLTHDLHDLQISKASLETLLAQVQLQE